MDNRNIGFDENGRPTWLLFTNDFAAVDMYRRRFKSSPTLDPTTDDTIPVVIANKENHVADMIQAVYDTTNCQDNPNYEGIEYSTRGHPNSYQPKEVEATCWTLFQAVIERCQSGFRGHNDHNRLAPSRRGKLAKQVQNEDVLGSCQQRIRNVILALREWKSVCVEVVTSDDKVLNLANSPATHRRDKLTQKIANRRKAETNVQRKKDAKDAKAMKDAAVTETPPSFPVHPFPSTLPYPTQNPSPTYTAASSLGLRRRGLQPFNLATVQSLPITGASNTGKFLATPPWTPATSLSTGSTATHTGPPYHHEKVSPALGSLSTPTHPLPSNDLGSYTAILGNHQDDGFDTTTQYKSIGNLYRAMAPEKKQPIIDQLQQYAALPTIPKPLYKEVSRQTGPTTRKAAAAVPISASTFEPHVAKEQRIDLSVAPKEVTDPQESQFDAGNQFLLLRDSVYFNLDTLDKPLGGDVVSNAEQMKWAEDVFNEASGLPEFSIAGFESVVPMATQNDQLGHDIPSQSMDNKQSISAIAQGVKRGRRSDVDEELQFLQPEPKRSKKDASGKGGVTAEEIDFSTYGLGSVLARMEEGFVAGREYDDNDLFGDHSDGLQDAASVAQGFESGSEVDAVGEDDDDAYGRY
ncbi:hypothetical protein GQ44DRAFT_724035 [Phaeosphaeriaceae sp. PMI808]|nr:hypothetical protein GQ44DRAFT_724035 [Phaeosphaeriaceae sp. PMI808]